MNNKEVNSESNQTAWTVCPACQGRGKRSRRLRKKVRLLYLKELSEFERLKNEGPAPVRPKGHLESCSACAGSGLLASASFPEPDTEKYPNVAIIGGGIGGVALAVACLHRGIPFTLYERDLGFNARSQGYGLTLQQASKAIEGFGIFSLEKGVVSTRHVVHTTEGKIVGEWGMRKWMQSDTSSSPKRTNIHIARQSLRSALIEQLGGHDVVKWGHQLVGLKEGDDVDLSFLVDGELQHIKADLVVGADGIRSTVRRLQIGEETTPLRYLGCIAILGICPLADLDGFDNDLLDSATVFQTANGNERIYIMPYDANSVMWQLSFPMAECDAKALSAQGVKALKEEACRRTQWHDPIPQILAATQAAQVSGYPVYDRELLTPALLEKSDKVTLIGDAAHPMSPFKGQGANQALLDALALAREISKGCWSKSQWRKAGIRVSVLSEFEAEMLERSAIKVEGSAEAAEFLHSDIVLYEGDEPRGRALKREDS
ncbi:FAD-dependent oxidoreductase [Marinomonas rhizomae]|uniref:2-polyprenyl-6-methoxyphenol hydroxylase-like FAD-dependent oxidoreductase n=1 Tax=Marinomonas rhizomae TaxID=491948 RepID=A0A366J2M9_9GAMM|nr:NAD(P)/FAD-dependent oxidoreductase [Marinomonas rhizomae]RBP80514.1 2-polyprenyl-6-methoxyphenol hydroxylase-like FAD-dependent oxidoreductase [Marinomonas rhizomae]